MAVVNQVERAARAWPVLIAVAKKRDTITYGQLAKALGIHHRPIRYVLGILQSYCLSEELPPLTILVVNQSGEPGPGFIAHDFDDLDSGYEKVWKYSWSKLENPFLFASDGTTLDGLTDSLVKDPDSSGEIYAKVKSRGIKQILFRNAILRAYRGKCAFTELSFPEALEACHIVPWSQATESERLNVRNGILLNSFHHKLFDRGLITFTVDYKIHYLDPQRRSGNYSKMDSMLTAKLHGKKMHVPFQKKQRPEEELIRRHYELQEWEL